MSAACASPTTREPRESAGKMTRKRSRIRTRPISATISSRAPAPSIRLWRPPSAARAMRWLAFSENLADRAGNPRNRRPMSCFAPSRAGNPRLPGPASLVSVALNLLKTMIYLLFDCVAAGRDANVRADQLSRSRPLRPISFRVPDLSGNDPGVEKRPSGRWSVA